MDILDKLFDSALASLPAVLTAGAVLIVIVVARIVLLRQAGVRTSRRFRIQILTLILSLVGLVAVIMMLPMSETSKGQLLSLLGILLSAAIALSSTTLIGNAMAGFMLRAVRNFRGGDFVQVDGQFGRISEMGLFHIEIQAEDSNLVTLPNVYLVTHPVKVLRSTGTIISAEVSLGYDVSRTRIEKQLLRAAERTGLTDPFVYIVDLGDFSVTYRISGLLIEVKHILSMRSRLRQMMLDCLHEDGIEIVSPTFMNQRRVESGRRFMPEVSQPKAADRESEEVAPEDIVFDKAEEAESLERLRERYEVLEASQKELKARLHETLTDTQREELKSEIDQLDRRRERIAELLRRKEEPDDKASTQPPDRDRPSDTK